jgi:hypothetical protein
MHKEWPTLLEGQTLCESYWEQRERDIRVYISVMAKYARYMCTVFTQSCLRTSEYIYATMVSSQHVFVLALVASSPWSAGEKNQLLFCRVPDVSQLDWNPLVSVHVSSLQIAVGCQFDPNSSGDALVESTRKAQEYPREADVGPLEPCDSCLR